MINLIEQSLKIRGYLGLLEKKLLSRFIIVCITTLLKSSQIFSRTPKWSARLLMIKIINSIIFSSVISWKLEQVYRLVAHGIVRLMFR